MCFGCTVECTSKFYSESGQKVEASKPNQNQVFLQNMSSEIEKLFGPSD